jgi:hypothetical protein
MPTSKLITMATATGSDDITNNTAAPKPFSGPASGPKGPKSESLPPPISWQPPLLIALIKITIIWPAQSAIDGVGNSRFAFLSANVLLLPFTFQFGRPRLFLAREPQSAARWRFEEKLKIISISVVKFFTLDGVDNAGGFLLILTLDEDQCWSVTQKYGENEMFANRVADPLHLHNEMRELLKSTECCADLN